MTKDERIHKSLKKLSSYNASSRVKLRAKQTQQRGFSIYFDYYVKGERSYDFLGLYLSGDPTNDSEVLGQALQLRKMKEEDLSSQAAGVRLNTWQRKSDAIAWISEQAKRKTGTWKRVISSLKNFHPAPLRFNDITPQFAEGFKEYLLEKHSQNTAWLYLNTFKTALNLAVKNGILMTNPAKNVTIKMRDTERSHLTSEELKVIEATPCNYPEIKRAFLFACYSGLRISDIVRLEWKSIDLVSNTISIRQKKTDSMLYIPLLDDAKRILGTPGSGLVFDLPTEAYINRKLKTWVSEAGISKDISFHCARHTFAIMALEAGIEINVIQVLLGHSILSTTMIYAKVNPKVLQGAADRLNRFHKGE